MIAYFTKIGGRPKLLKGYVVSSWHILVCLLSAFYVESDLFVIVACICAAAAALVLDDVEHIWDVSFFKLNFDDEVG